MSSAFGLCCKKSDLLANIDVMLTLLHISDLHFGPVFKAEVGEALARAAVELRPDVIVASGDFTQRAKVAQFVAARGFLDRLPDVPKIVVPGNHDVPLYRVAERLWNPYGNYRRFISEQLDTIYRRDDAVIVALNTTAPLPRIVDGRITRRQIAFSAEAFRDAPPEATRIVVAHHHFAPPPDYDERQSVVRRARQALDQFSASNVELLLCGHLHRGFIVDSHDVYPAKGDQGRILILHSGTTTSTRGRARERGKNSFNLIEIDAAEIRIAQWMYIGEQREFAPVRRSEFPRHQQRFLGQNDDMPPTNNR